MIKLNKCAFTLSEVLITLGIIGVVAAVTLPTLIANYQKQSTVNKIKKFYTNINQVLQMAIIDNGEYNTWSYENSEDFYKKYIEPYIKNVDKTSFIYMHGDFTSGIKFIFSDGTQAIFSKTSNFVGSPVFIFYTNTHKHSDLSSKYLKNPTRERFYFKLNASGVIEPPNLLNTRERNLQSCKSQWRDRLTDEQTNNGNIDCSTVIYKDGWKIAPDYPW